MRYADGYWWSNDGLRLHYRDYPGPAQRPTILCLPGLTRNARDYATLAERLSPEWRVIAVEFRGRGESAYAKDPMTYVPLTYVQDVERLLAELKLQTVIPIGTSLGGIVAMLLAATGRERIAAVVLNDIGPVIETAGLDRIKSYVGRTGSWPTWVHAARALNDNTQDVYPGYRLEDWLAMAKRLYRLTPQGRVVPDYDKGISEPFRLPGGEAGVDLWPTLSALADVPTLIVRGELSDILSTGTAQSVAATLTKSTLITVPRVGHAPTLDEPEAVAAIEALLAQL
jgi:pimeloyl-ACP methyl ester carboxylesterase